MFFCLEFARQVARIGANSFAGYAVIVAIAMLDAQHLYFCTQLLSYVFVHVLLVWHLIAFFVCLDFERPRFFERHVFVVTLVRM